MDDTPPQGGFRFKGKLIIATPFYNMQAYSTYLESLLVTVRLLDKLGVRLEYWPLHGDSYVQRARNGICARFLKDKENTDLFFIDSDESWELGGFLRILLSEKEVIGASYKMKNRWNEWTASPYVKDGHPVGEVNGDKSAIIEAALLPAGFMRIKRSVLERMIEQYPELEYHESTEPEIPHFSFFECARPHGTFYGEDAMFCKRWKDIGGKLWIEPQATITHYGMVGHTGNLHETMSEQ